VGGKLSNLEIDVEDSVTSLMHYDGEWGNFPISLHQDFVQRPPVRTFKIVGDKSIALVDLIKNQLFLHNKDGDIVEQWDGAVFKRNDMFLEQMRHFLDCVAGQSNPQVNLHDGIQSLCLALAAKDSLANRKIVTL
jgi:predicted dehydrogenase